MTLHYNRTMLKWRRKNLRQNSSDAEKVLWERLRNKRLSGYKFKWQYSVDSFVIDFYCSKVKLGIEVDGEVHFTKEAQNRDENRSGFLSDFGIEVIRFRNDEVFNNLEKVISTIEHKLKELEKSKS